MVIILSPLLHHITLCQKTIEDGPVNFQSAILVSILIFRLILSKSHWIPNQGFIKYVLFFYKQSGQYNMKKETNKKLEVESLDTEKENHHHFQMIKLDT